MSSDDVDHCFLAVSWNFCPVFGSETCVASNHLWKLNLKESCVVIYCAQRMNYVVSGDLLSFTAAPLLDHRSKGTRCAINIQSVRLTWHLPYCCSCSRHSHWTITLTEDRIRAESSCVWGTGHNFVGNISPYLKSQFPLNEHNTFTSPTVVFLY